MASLKESVTPPGLKEEFTKPAGFEWGSFERAGRTIRTGQKILPDARGTVIFLTGLNEFTEKYFELARDIEAQGLNFVTMDWMGQGGSGRYLEGTNRNYPTAFENHIEDLNTFVREHVLPNTQGPHFLLSHSMGGHFVQRFASQNPDTGIKGMGLSNPMNDINLRGIPAWIAFPVARAMSKVPALGKMYAPGNKDWEYDPTDRNPGKDIYTSDPERGALYMAWTRANENLRTRGVTFKWVFEAMKSIYKSEKNKELENIQIPVVLGLATDDKLVPPEAILDGAIRLPNVEVLVFKGAEHELLHGTDKDRNRFLHAFFAMVDEQIEAYNNPSFIPEDISPKNDHA